MQAFASLLLATLILLKVNCQDKDVDHEVATFQKLFMAKRIEQLSAVKNILKLEDQKRRILLDQITAKLFQVLSSGKSDPELGAKIASETAVPEQASLILENTCLASDLLLRLPDQMHRMIKKVEDRVSVFKWAVDFSLETGLLDESSIKLLSLASQELGLVERDPNYVNPYRVEKKPAKRFEEPPPPKKKERKKIKKGPRMSGGEL